jgi:hypothetical protein
MGPKHEIFVARVVDKYAFIAKLTQRRREDGIWKSNPKQDMTK